MSDDRPRNAGYEEGADRDESPSEALIRQAREDLEDAYRDPRRTEPGAGDDRDRPDVAADLDQLLDDEAEALENRLDRKLDELDASLPGASATALESAMADMADDEGERTTRRPHDSASRRVVRPATSPGERLDLGAPADSPSANPVDSGPEASSLAAVIIGAVVVIGIGIAVLLLIAVLTGSGTSASSLEPGDCLAEPDAEQVTTVDTVPCDEPHVFEVMGSVTLADEASYPGDEATFQSSLEACQELFPTYVGAGYQGSDWYVNTFTPSQEGWENGDRSATCLVFQFDESLEYAEVVGTARGSET